ncbi:MAG: hypothetical protein PHE88_12130 [Elusimicrobia bacterium]|nr:hypothetical protein [Elusimicrobiota bacterium]
MADYKRKIVLIDRKMQFKYAFMIGGALIFMLLVVEYHTFLTIKLALPNILSTSVGAQIKEIHLWLIINGLVYALFIGVISIYMSHKIAGPIFKIKKDLREIIDTGNTNKQIFIRKGDELNDLVALINELLQKVEIKK